jgi:DNA polymerase-3 subunit gamma/tau
VAEETYQSLYRRYRPQRFSEVRGQDHVTRALRNSVRTGTVNHAYLFSGPRGTGKTSSARILAKALNCLAPDQGEPCGSCGSCLAVAAGASLDVHELDAASNNGVEAMRDLVSRAALGTPGRWKVYIIDEVHMLSAAASNALLKTLEEPPGHVVFVLATTDPQKVLDTIKSRTQHFEFRLLGGEVLAGLLADVSQDAALDLPREALDLAVRRGHGSARDALSFLDQVAAAGVYEDEGDYLEQLIEALSEADARGVLAAVAQAVQAGRDPSRIGSELIAQLRNGFLASMAPELVPLPDEAREQAGRQAGRLGTAAVVRIIEGVGKALVEMRDALDARVYLEVTLVRLIRAQDAGSLEALAERLDRLEARWGQLDGGKPRSARPLSQAAATGAQPDRPDWAGTPRPEGTPAQPGRPDSPAAGARQALGAVRNRQPAAPETGAPKARRSAPPEASIPDTAAAASPPPGGGREDRPAPGAGASPDRDSIVQAWGDGLLSGLPPRARARYRTGRFVSTEGAEVTFAVANEPHRRMCEECRRDVEDALSAHFATRLSLRLTVDAEAGSEPQPRVPEDEEDFDISQLAPAGGGADLSPEERLLRAFPGAEELS